MSCRFDIFEAKMESFFEYIKENVFPGPVDYRKYEYVCVVGDDDDEEEKVAAKIRNIPQFLNPFIWTNAGIYQSYFSVGIAMYILSTPVSYYMIDTLDVSSLEYSAYATLIALPWSLKFIFGSISDSVSIFGYRRKSWMTLMWVSYSLICFYLAAVGGPSFGQTTAWTFLMTCAYLQADVCHDAMCVERSRHEFEEIKGSFQTGAYSIRSYGAVIGATIGALLYNTSNWGWGLTISQFFVLVGLIPVFTMLPTLWNLEEVQSKRDSPSLYDLAQDIWGTLQLRAVWYPMIFIYTYYVLQVPNSAWTNFLVEGLDFSDFELGILSIAGAVLFWFGMFIFKMFFFSSSWRYIYLFTSLVNFVFSIAQVSLSSCYRYFELVFFSNLGFVGPASEYSLGHSRYLLLPRRYFDCLLHQCYQRHAHQYHVHDVVSGR